MITNYGSVLNDVMSEEWRFRRVLLIKEENVQTVASIDNGNPGFFGSWFIVEIRWGV